MRGGGGVLLIPFPGKIKTNGSFRTIIHLEPLNKFIVKERFKMETIKSAVNLLFPD